MPAKTIVSGLMDPLNGKGEKEKEEVEKEEEDRKRAISGSEELNFKARCGKSEVKAEKIANWLE